MSFERDINHAVQLMFEHAKYTISTTLMQAVRKGDITIEMAKLPGLNLLIGRAIDQAKVESSRQLNCVLTEGTKKKNSLLPKAKKK